MCVSASSSNDLCLVCEMIVQYVEAMLDQKASVEEIEKVLKKVCNFLPDSMKSEVGRIHYFPTYFSRVFEHPTWRGW